MLLFHFRSWPLFIFIDRFILWLTGATDDGKNAQSWSMQLLRQPKSGSERSVWASTSALGKSETEEEAAGAAAAACVTSDPSSAGTLLAHSKLGTSSCLCLSWGFFFKIVWVWVTRPHGYCRKLHHPKPPRRRTKNASTQTESKLRLEFFKADLLLEI